MNRKYIEKQAQDLINNSLHVSTPELQLKQVADIITKLHNELLDDLITQLIPNANWEDQNDNIIARNTYAEIMNILESNKIML